MCKLMEHQNLVGREWDIPVDAIKSLDGRVTTDEYKNWRKSKM